MNAGILAACLPALRPLFASLLETANAIKTSGIRGRTRANGIGGRYYIHDEDLKLASIPSRSTLSRLGYGVTVKGSRRGEEEGISYRQGSATSSGPLSKLEASLEENDYESESMLPLQMHAKAYIPRGRDARRGILRTTEVMVSR